MLPKFVSSLKLSLSFFVFGMLLSVGWLTLAQKPVLASTTIQDQCEVDRSKLDWNETGGTNNIKHCVINQFNSSLGVLENVQISFSAQSDTQEKLENKDAIPQTMTSSVIVDLDLLRPDNTNQLSLNIPFSSRIFEADLFDGVIDYGGESGKSYPLQNASKTNTATLVSENDLNYFTGTGTIDFLLQAVADWDCSGSGNAACEVDTYASAVITVLYTYAEPQPDLVINTCQGETITETDDGLYTVTMSNQGTGAVNGEIETSLTLPPCVSFVEVVSENWVCEVRVDEGSGDLVSCVFTGTVPADAFVPDLVIKLAAEDCAIETLSTKVVAETDDESNPNNNSLNCVITAIVTTPPDVDDNPDDNPEDETDGEVEGTTDESCIEITGILFHDLNSNGVKDADEPVLPNVEVVVTDSNGKNIVISTNDQGEYVSCLKIGPARLVVNLSDSDIPDNSRVTTQNEIQSINVSPGMVKFADIGFGPGSVLGAVLENTGYLVGLSSLVGFVLLTILFLLLRNRKAESRVVSDSKWLKDK